MPCKIQTLLFLIFTFTGVLIAVEPPPTQEYDYEDPPQGLFYEEWMEMQLGGEKVGWSHATYTRMGDEIRTQIDTFMRMARAAMQIEVKSSERTVERVTGEPLGFETSMTLSGQDIITIGTIKGDTVSVTTKGPGYAETVEYPFQTDARMTWGLARQSFEEGIEPGNEYTMLVYSPSISAERALPGSIEIGPMEDFDYLGTKMHGYKVINTLKIGPTDVITESWTTEQGRLLVSNMDMMGMPMSMVVVDQESALKDFVAPEFFISNLISLNRAIPDDASSVTYALSLKKGSLEDNLPPESDTQSVRWDGDKNVALITVHRADHLEISKEVLLPMGAEMVSFLSSNMILNSDDPEVKALAAKTPSKTEESGLEKAYALTAFVRRFIENKNLGVGFATAREVVEDPQGDCSEHAVLLAALGRVKGIPTRVAAGLLYLPRYQGRDNVMGYHMWTQFHIGGRWLDFDATTYEQIANPTRIALFYSSLENESLAEIGIGLMNVLGNLSVEVVSIEE